MLLCSCPSHKIQDMFNGAWLIWLIFVTCIMYVHTILIFQRQHSGIIKKRDLNPYEPENLSSVIQCLTPTNYLSGFKNRRGLGRLNESQGLNLQAPEWRGSKTNLIIYGTKKGAGGKGITWPSRTNDLSAQPMNRGTCLRAVNIQCRLSMSQWKYSRKEERCMVAHRRT